MDLLLHFKVNEGDENNINIQEYMLYGDVETKSEKCLVDEGDEVVLTEFPVPEFKNCTLMKKGDEGFYEYKDYRQGENAELAGGYAVSGILQQNKRFDFNYVNDQINGIVQNPFYKVETMGDYQIPMRVLDAYNDLYVATLATTEYIYYLHDSDDVLMVGLENRQTIARGEFAMDSYQESFENIYYGNSYEEEIWMDEDRKDAILHCLADETLEYVYDRTSTGFYYVSTDNLRFTANERFDINLTDEDLSKIYDYMNLDFYVLDSECEWDEDENGEYFGIAVGSDRVNGGYEFGDYCDLDEERYELRQTLFDEMCGQNPIAYDADKECLTLPDGRVINNMLSREQAVKHYEDYIYNEVNQNQEVKEMTEMLYGDELEKDDLEECL